MFLRILLHNDKPPGVLPGADAEIEIWGILPEKRLALKRVSHSDTLFPTPFIILWAALLPLPSPRASLREIWRKKELSTGMSTEAREGLNSKPGFIFDNSHEYTRIPRQTKAMRSTHTFYIWNGIAQGRRLLEKYSIRTYCWNRDNDDSTQKMGGRISLLG